MNLPSNAFQPPTGIDTDSAAEKIPKLQAQQPANADAVDMEELHSTEDDFRRRSPLLWRLTLYGPFAVSIVATALLAVLAGTKFAGRIVGAAALSAWVMGRFIILTGSEAAFLDFSGPLSAEHLFLLVMWMDVMTALVLAFHIGFLFRIPLIGTRVLALVTDGHFILDAHPWMRRATFVGLTGFVMFPLTATGAVGGSVFGRLLGMSRFATFTGIVLGSFLGNGIMYFFAEQIAKVADRDHPVIKYGGFVLIALITVILERRYRTLRAKYQSGELQQH
ncbi:MAG: small multi-drug export protein [Planctomycetaceae bacterium]|nr:small multi-drug export protein [Planctomycetaceae bacterium]